MESAGPACFVGGIDSFVAVGDSVSGDDTLVGQTRRKTNEINESNDGLTVMKKGRRSPAAP
jgi:hypothetical protein